MRILTALAVLLAWPAYAQNNCAPREVVLEMLTQKYGESRQSIGMMGGANVMEMWANMETGSWSAVITRPDGIACVAASGQSFERLDEELEPAGLRL